MLKFQGSETSAVAQLVESYYTWFWVRVPIAELINFTIMKYKIKGYQIIYENGCRDKVSLEVPYVVNDKEKERAKIFMRNTSLGLKCKGVNLYIEELNQSSV